MHLPARPKLFPDGQGNFLVTDAGAFGYGGRVFRVNGQSKTLVSSQHDAPLPRGLPCLIRLLTTGCWELHERVLKPARRRKRHGRDAWWSDFRDPGRQRNQCLLHFRHWQLPHSLRGSVREHHDGVFRTWVMGSWARKNLCPSEQVAGVGWPVPGSSPYCVNTGNGLLGTNVRERNVTLLMALAVAYRCS